MKLLVEKRVRWIEMAAASPAWTSIICFYIEGHRGHLMNEEVFKAQHTTAVRGNIFSFHMPWEDILTSLKEALEDKDLRLLPHSGAVIAHMIRFNLRIGTIELAKHLKEAKLRGEVVLALGRELITSGHRAFVNERLLQKPLRKAAANVLDSKRSPPCPSGLEAVIHAFEDRARARYPEAVFNEPDGAMLPEVASAIEASIKRRDASKKQPPSGIFDKNATPASGPKLLQHVFEEVRPMAVLEERHSDSATDMNAQRNAALQRYSTLQAQTDMKWLPQWCSEYLTDIYPFSLGAHFGGAEYCQSKHKAKRRCINTEPIPSVVTSFDVTSGLPRRVEGNVRSDWNLTPILRNLHFRYRTLETPSLGVKTVIDSNEPAVSYARQLQAAVEGLYHKLAKGTYGKGKRRRRVNGDITKLQYANNLTPLERELLTNMRFMTRKLEGTQEVRLLLNHALFGAQVCYGEGIFFTISPNERHSALTIRLSRHRRNDPIVASVEDNTGHDGDEDHDIAGQIDKETRAAWASAEWPRLEAEETDEGTASTPLPPQWYRRIMQARDPYAGTQAFNVLMRVVLPRVLGIRMCPLCPHCNANEMAHPCQTKFGSNMRPMGSILRSRASVPRCRWYWLRSRASARRGGARAWKDLRRLCLSICLITGNRR